MSTLGTRNKRLYIDFRYKGVRYKEYTGIPDTPSNRQQAKQLLKQMDAEITLGTFDYLKYFPDGKSAAKFRAQQKRRADQAACPYTFGTFAEVWFNERKVEWRDSYKNVNRINLDKYLLPYFKSQKLDEIDKAKILEFRGYLAEQKGQSAARLSASRINHIMIPLRMILTEASDRFRFQSPWQNIKPLKESKTKVDPFSLAEVQKFLSTVRADFHAYYTVRFFTGMRSSEVDGLQWKYVDFDRKQILVREALVQGKMVGTKNDGSSREIDMNSFVFEVLQRLREQESDTDTFVFSTKSGSPLHNRNVTQRVWYPLLRNLGLPPRRPYQTRHTCATLWLAAGENPEWIARQMGHVNTKMLFEVYSRFVPNLTRRDGSAFESLLKSEMKE